MKAMTAIESLNFVKGLLDHAYKKGAFNDTDNGPLDMHTMVECVFKLSESAALLDQTTMMRQQMQAQQAQAEAAEKKAPCGDCDEKAKAEKTPQKK